MDEASTPQLLDCDNKRPFWVRFVNNSISVGSGHVYGDNEFLRYNMDDTEDFSSIAATTDVWGSWEFLQDEGEGWKQNGRRRKGRSGVIKRVMKEGKV